MVRLAYRVEATELYWLEQPFLKVLPCQTGRLKSDEPCMTRSNAINLSLNNLRRNQIETSLQSIRKQNSFTSIKQNESLSMRMYQLSSKIRKIENSMNDAIKETMEYQLKKQFP
ncbi:unnamed protein product [Schistosoma margrebowiei]|uniref:Uncharacterized protein n=1 Tax=Schistosoma margrebowiei TaxID=48269 RepID=A0A183LSM0_9TREM|nr:unnamed protein product [Schistosoma margrebowiei]